MSLYVAPVSTRNQLGVLLNGMGLVGHGVEVGTHRGEFARLLLEKWNGRLHCVDPWEDFPPEYAEQVPLLDHSTGNRVRDRKAAEARLIKFTVSGRCVLHRATSVQAAPEFQPESLDFVYLDGDHRTPEVLRDLELWWPKVRPGGMLAGHDIVCPGEGPDGKWGACIQPAVFGFFRDGDCCDPSLPIHLVVEEGGLPWSFYVIKPKDPG